jgi:hypothetical protein
MGLHGLLQGYLPSFNEEKQMLQVHRPCFLNRFYAPKFNIDIPNCTDSPLQQFQQQFLHNVTNVHKIQGRQRNSDTDMSSFKTKILLRHDFQVAYLLSYYSN